MVVSDREGGDAEEAAGVADVRFIGVVETGEGCIIRIIGLDERGQGLLSAEDGATDIGLLDGVILEADTEEGAGVWDAV